MLQHYYVNNKAQPNGDHEVHVSSCTYLAQATNVSSLGHHDNCASAVRQAKLSHTKSNGCYHCCRTCHTS
ncbi:Uncharacterised protein [Aeromonas encheleia]|nr:Uncharacterised protein [Aeromonas encheleia]